MFGLTLRGHGEVTGLLQLCVETCDWIADVAKNRSEWAARKRERVRDGEREKDGESETKRERGRARGKALVS